MSDKLPARISAASPQSEKDAALAVVIENERRRNVRLRALPPNATAADICAALLGETT